MHTEATRDKDATDTDGIWREAADRLRIATAAEAQNRSNAMDALRFVWGDQWDADVKNTRKIQQRPALTVNATAVFANRVKNTLRQQRPRIKCHPVGDGADIDTANTVNGLIRHIETLSDASVAYDRGVASAVDIGWGYWRIVSDYIDERSFDQELLIKPVRNPMSVYMDPAAKHPAGLDAGWCIISEMMKRAEYKRKYPNAENCEWRYGDAPGDGTLDWESKEEIRLAEYYRVHEIKDTLILMNDGSLVFKSELPPEAIRDATNYTPQIGEDGKPVERPTTRRVVQWFRLNGKTIVDRRNLPGHYVPVIRCEGQVEEIDGRVNRKGMVQDLMDPARMFNYTETQKTERYALTPKAPWVMAEGQADGHPEWDDANTASYSRLTYKPVTAADGVTTLPPPQRTPPAAVEAGMAEWSQSAERNLLTVAGMAPESPEIAGRIVSGNKYLQRRQGMQDLAHFQYYDNQTIAIQATGTVLLDLIPHYYDTKRMQRIVREDGLPEIVTINDEQVSDGVKTVKNNLQVGRYDVTMDTGPGYATKREENSESMLELLKTALGEVVVKTGADVVLRNLDFPGASELADRAMVTNPEALGETVKQLPEQARTIIGAMQQQIQQLEQVVQQQGLEIKYHDMAKDREIAGRLAVAEGANQTKLRVAGVDTTTKLAVEDSKATTARDVAEINAAKQLLNTQAESASEERKADKLIEAGLKDSRKD